jgi:hypothetical protein
METPDAIDQFPPILHRHYFRSLEVHQLVPLMSEKLMKTDFHQVHILRRFLIPQKGWTTHSHNLIKISQFNYGSVEASIEGILTDIWDSACTSHSCRGYFDWQQDPFGLGP